MSKKTIKKNPIMLKATTMVSIRIPIFISNTVVILVLKHQTIIFYLKRKEIIIF